MKKSFLLIGFLGCFAAHAQLKDVFDIQKHLEKKTKVQKEVILQPVLKLQPLKNLFSMNNPEVLLPYTLPNGDKVINLPVDNMPCVVPDMKQFQSMPNMNYGNNMADIIPRIYSPGNIPNPASPFRIETL